MMTTGIVCNMLSGISMVFFGLVLLDTITASQVKRQRRFITPTTYPVPTIPAKGQLLGSSLVTSVPVRCPLKREAGDGMRIFLDDDLMRQIYLAEVGSIDRRYLAETMSEAQESFDRAKPGISRTNRVRNLGLFHHIRQWLSKAKAHRQTGVNNSNNPWRQQSRDHTGRPDHFADDTGLTRSKARVRRNADGSISTLAFCTPRGNTTADGFMHMCSSCALTTVLPDDRFPRYINEVDCDARDCDCFNVRGTANGKCKTRIQPVKMLRKVPNGCRLTIHNGQQVITDNWEIYDHPLRVGCECVINKLSVFATFIPKPSG